MQIIEKENPIKKYAIDTKQRYDPMPMDATDQGSCRDEQILDSSKSGFIMLNLTVIYL